MRGHKTRHRNANRDKRGRAARPVPPSARPDRLAGLIGIGAVGALAGGIAVGFATIPGSGLSVPAARHDILAATTSGSAQPAAVLLASSFSAAFISPAPSASPSASPSPTPTPSGGNMPVPSPSPSATPSPTPGDPDQSAPAPSPSPTPTPTTSKTTGPGKSSGKTSGSGKSSTGSKTSGSNSNLAALDLGSVGDGGAGGTPPLVNVPGFAPENPTGLFPTVSPGSGANPGAKGKHIEAVTTAATTPLDTLIPGQVVGLAVLVGAISLAFVRFSLRTPQPSGSGGKSAATSAPEEPQ
jgi:hypothetical protein